MNFGTTEIIFLSYIGIICLGIVVAGVVVYKFVGNKQPNQKKSPFCAEMIQLEAVVCRYCSRDLH